MPNTCRLPHAALMQRVPLVAAAMMFAIAIASALPTTGLHARQAKERATDTGARSELPMTIVVSIDDQSLSVYSGDERISRVPISTGRRGYETPTGIFSIIQKRRIHFSNLYDDAPMPFMQRITWSGIALHAGPLPGYPASHGCIRMPHGFAQKLFSQTTMGGRVIVGRSSTKPYRISHPRLAAFAIAAQHDRSRSAAATSTSALAGAMHLGATSASAGSVTDAAPSPTPTSTMPPSLLREARARLELATEQLRAATTARTAATAEIGEIIRAANTARTELIVAKREANEARRALAAVEAEADTVKRRIADIVRMSFDDGVGSQSADAESAQVRLGAREDALEAELLEVLANANDAQLDLALAEASLPELEHAYRSANERRMEASRRINLASNAMARAEQEHAEAKRELARRQLPVSMMISRKTAKLYVRQGFTPLLEADVVIADADQPLGTHVFTAVEADASHIQWQAITIPDAGTGSRQRGRNAKDQATSGSASNANEALGRVTIPDEVVAKLGELVKPGSSLIVSDYGLSRETGKGTDLIVVTR